MDSISTAALAQKVSAWGEKLSLWSKGEISILSMRELCANSKLLCH